MTLKFKILMVLLIILNIIGAIAFMIIPWLSIESTGLIMCIITSVIVTFGIITMIIQLILIINEKVIR